MAGGPKTPIGFIQ